MVKSRLVTNLVFEVDCKSQCEPTKVKQLTAAYFETVSDDNFTFVLLCNDTRIYFHSLCPTNTTIGSVGH